LVFVVQCTTLLLLLLLVAASGWMWYNSSNASRVSLQLDGGLLVHPELHAHVLVCQRTLKLIHSSCLGRHLLLEVCMGCPQLPLLPQRGCRRLILLHNMLGLLQMVKL
jgi:hypothetical protein